MMKTPAFWSHRGAAAIALLPLTLLWRAGGALKQATARPHKPAIPIICVGNLTAGGTGKTPLVGWLADRMRERGWQPAILTRGYGGSASGPLWVDPDTHDAGFCGDEPLMLADGRPVMVARDRAAGARTIAAGGTYDLIVMDDGMQNPTVQRTLTIGVFDGGSGVGNGWLIPAGPLRTPLASGLRQLDIAVINGADETKLTPRLSHKMPVFDAALRPEASVIEALADTPLLAFAGIGRPARFFAGIEAIGGQIAKRLSFADHHPYSQQDLAQIQEDAQRHGAEMITTQKDWMRLPADWRARVAMLPVSADMADEAGFLDAVVTGLAAAGHGNPADG
ncbi:MAG: tetraacyldisaccharide 4'-kinase [Pseudomonadota bacterium]|nr:tetraacyldisaccharide 4'-kinase [Pseudomonadota bacterium]